MDKLFSIVLFVLALSACSSDTVKRTNYETLKNIAHQQCVRELGSDCPEDEKYDDYQKRRDAELEKKPDN